MTSPAAVNLRRETPADAEAVAMVVSIAFGPDEPVLPELVAALRPLSRFGADPGPLSVVAEVDSAVVGQVMLTRIPAPAFQVVVLPGHEAWMTGTLVYPHPFWDLDCVGLRDRAFVERLEAAATGTSTPPSSSGGQQMVSSRPVSTS